MASFVDEVMGGRAPHGARGLKHVGDDMVWLGDKSRPARGAWIETILTPSGPPARNGRAPHGARGLKPDKVWLDGMLEVSRPARGAWIETYVSPGSCQPRGRS